MGPTVIAPISREPVEVSRLPFEKGEEGLAVLLEPSLVSRGGLGPVNLT